VLNQPERLWMQYIDFEIAGERREQARALYERLLERTQHVKVRCCVVACRREHVECVVLRSVVRAD
jgi:hypothetical protein